MVTLPASLHLGPLSSRCSEWARLFRHRSFQSSQDASLFWSIIGLLLGNWLGCLVIPMDWDVVWQRWPIPNVIAGSFGYLLGALGGLVFTSKRQLPIVEIVPHRRQSPSKAVPSSPKKSPTKKSVTSPKKSPSKRASSPAKSPKKSAPAIGEPSTPRRRAAAAAVATASGTTLRSRSTSQTPRSKGKSSRERSVSRSPRRSSSRNL